MVKLIPCDAIWQRRAKQRSAKILSTSQSVKHVTAEQENIFIMFNFASLI